MKLYRFATMEPAVIPGTITPSNFFDPSARPEHKGIELAEEERGIRVTRGLFSELVPWSNVRVASYRRAEPQGKVTP
jgi:hypothetical protein